MPDMEFYQLEFMDTLTVCPGELVKFRNISNYYLPVQYSWDFGDGNSVTGRDAKHNYAVNGIYTVNLTATTSCGGVNSISKTVIVDDGKLPIVQLGVVPQEICPGETVYFFDDEFSPINNYTYSVDFGDGTVINDIVNINDT